MRILKLAKNKLVALVATMALAITGAVSANVSAQAAGVPNVSCSTNPRVFDTAWNGTTGVLASGNDLNWKLYAKTNATNTPVRLGAVTPSYSTAVVVDTPPSAWNIPAGAKYISGNNTGSQTGTNTVGAADYNSDIFYRYDFTLDARVNPADFRLTGNLYADNSVIEIYVNGVPQSSAFGGNQTALPTGGATPYTYAGFKSAYALTLTIGNNWVSGNNTVVVQIASAMSRQGFAGDFSYVAPCSTTVPVLGCESNPNMFNTAWDGQYGRIASGTDSYWKVSAQYYAADTPASAPSTGYNSASIVTNPPSAWAALSNASWISQNSTGSQVGSGTTTDPTYRANFFYRYDFDLANTVDPSTVRLDAALYADNAVTEVYVNGVAQSTTAGGTVAALPTGGTDPYTYGGFKSDSATRITLNHDWVAGSNSIIIKLASGMSREGFAATFAPSASCPTPIPTPPTPVTVDKAVATCVAGSVSTVTITGTGFTANTTVTIGGLTAQVQSWTSTELVVALPIGSNSGLLDVEVTENGSTATGASFYSNACPNTPDPLAIVSAELSCTGTATITVTGQGMTVNAVVEIQGQPTTVISRTADTIVVAIPADIGTPPLDITLIDGSQEATGQGLITEICPSVPPTPDPELLTVQLVCDKLHPDTIKITGANFTVNTTVKVGDVDAEVISLTDSTEMFVRIPAGLPTGLTMVSLLQGDYQVDKVDAFYNGCVCVDPDGDFDWDNEGGSKETESPKPKVDLNGDCNGYGWAFGCNNGNHYGYETTQSPDPGGDNDHTVVSSGEPTGSSNDGPNNGKANGKVTGDGKVKKASVFTIQTAYFSISDATITHSECPDPSEGVGGDDDERSPSPSPSPTHTEGSDDDDNSSLIKCDSPTVTPDPSVSPEPEKTEAPKVDLNGDCNGYGWAFGCNNGNHYGYETTQSPDPGGDNDHTVVSDPTPTSEPTVVQVTNLDPAKAYPMPDVVKPFTPLGQAAAKVDQLTQQLTDAKAKLAELKKAKVKGKTVAKATTAVTRLTKSLSQAKKKLAKLSK
ncbi:MAG: IPT/TIG domain-containing protein [Micrococcales bacterium]